MASIKRPQQMLIGEIMKQSTLALGALITTQASTGRLGQQVLQCGQVRDVGRSTLGGGGLGMFNRLPPTDV